MDASLKNLAFIHDLQHEMLLVTDVDMQRLAPTVWFEKSGNMPAYLGRFNKELIAIWILRAKLLEQVEEARVALSDMLPRDTVMEQVKKLSALKQKSNRLSLALHLLIDAEFSNQSVGQRLFCVSGGFEVFAAPPDFMVQIGSKYFIVPVQ